MGLGDLSGGIGTQFPRCLRPCRFVPSAINVRRAVSAKRVANSDSLDDLAGGEIFRQEFGAIGGGGAGHDESIPERDAIENGAIDPFLDDCGSDLNDVENTEGPKLLAYLGSVLWY